MARELAPWHRSCAIASCRLPEAQLAHAEGRHAEALALMRPVLGEMHRLGGSHTQQDVLEQLFLDAALKAGSAEDIFRLAVERVAGRRPIPPERFVGWREAAANGRRPQRHRRNGPSCAARARPHN